MGVREVQRLSTLQGLKRALKSNALAMQILKDQREHLLALKAAHETKPILGGQTEETIE